MSEIIIDGYDKRKLASFLFVVPRETMLCTSYIYKDDDRVRALALRVDSKVYPTDLARPRRH